MLQKAWMLSKLNTTKLLRAPNASKYAYRDGKSDRSSRAHSRGHTNLLPKPRALRTKLLINLLGSHAFQQGKSSKLKAS